MRDEAVPAIAPCSSSARMVAGRHGHPQAGVGTAQQHHHHHQVIDARGEQSQQHQHRDSEARRGTPHQFLQAKAGRERGIELRGDEERGRIHGEQQTESARRQVIMLDHHVGRVRQVQKEARHAAGTDQYRADEMPVRQELAIGMEGTRQAAVRARRLGPRLLEGGQDAEPEDGRAQHHPEHAAPADSLNHEAAGQRREQRRDAEDQHQQRHQPCRFDAGVQVAHHRPRNHHAATGPQTLHKATQQEQFRIRCQGTGHAAAAEQREPHVQRQLATVHIGQRAVEQLASAHGDEEHGQAHLHRGSVRMQALADGGQRRQVHVDGKGADR